MSGDEVFAEILKDKIFYDHSGGGVTFSGGEPLLHAGPLRGVLEQCRSAGISTCIDTSLAVAWENIERVCEFTDLFLVDVKHAEEEEVRARAVLDNLARLVGNARVWVRIPVIPKWNASEEEMRKVVSALEPLRGGIEKVCLLPFHKTAEMRYKYLNREWERYPEMEDVPETDLAAFENLFAARGHAVQVGG
jgi:pyruvate formate lyase activating enzyme